MLNILLAEDNVGDVLLVEEALLEHQIENKLHVVRDGADALRFIAQMGKPGELPCPDLMLLDLNLPKIKGHQVLSELRQHTTCAQTPVIVVSSSDAEKDREMMAQLGVSDYFRKPSDFEAFMLLGAVVRRVAAEKIP